MLNNIHFLRPFWLLGLVPVLVLLVMKFKQRELSHAWREVCDSHLLPFIIQNTPSKRRLLSILYLFFLSLLLCISLAGPSWRRLPSPVFQNSEPRVILLDMSEAMLDNELSPNRLVRAKFKLHDLFVSPQTSQYGLIAFTEQAFIVSPLTDDTKTIDVLLPDLNPDIMPIDGHNLSAALQEGAKLITDAGFQEGKLLLLSATIPDKQSITVAHDLAKKGVMTSVLPVTNRTDLSGRFNALAAAGNGVILPFDSSLKTLQQWGESKSSNLNYHDKNIPVWQDEGRWFLIPLLLLLLPVFRRGWLTRITE